MRGSSFRDVNDRRRGERLEPLLTQLGPNAGLLRAGVGDVWSEIEMLVHPDRAGIEPGGHLERPVAVDDQTEPPRPKSVSLARSTTSSISEYRNTGMNSVITCSLRECHERHLLLSHG